MKPRTGHPETVTAVRAAEPEICGASSAYPDAPQLYTGCALDKGHDGPHSDGDYSWWPDDDQRRQQIADMEEEIALMEFVRSVQDDQNDIAAAERILAREKAALAELKKGWKEPNGTADMWSGAVSICKLCSHVTHLPKKCSVSIEIDRGCGECECNGKRCRDGDGEWFYYSPTEAHHADKQ